MGINERIALLRKNLNVSQVSFGEKIGMTGANVSNLENGFREVQDRHIKLILAAFPRVNEEWLRDGKGAMFRQVETDPELERYMAQMRVPDVLKTYIRVYEAQTPEMQKILDAHLQEFLTELMKEKASRETASEPEPKDPDLDPDQQAELERIKQEMIAEKKAVSASPDTVGA
jgi:transcriptional regulator with XRE-family HTH domain